MQTQVPLPAYVKAAVFLVGLYVLASILYIAQDIIIPVVYAIIVAVSISPLVNFLIARKFNRALAIITVLLFILLLVLLLIVLLGSQMTMLSEAWPQLTLKFQDLMTQSARWVSGLTDISVAKINTWVVNLKSDLIDNSGTAIGSTISTLGGVLATALLTPVYIFMILYYQPHLMQFIHMVFDTEKDDAVNEILVETETIIQSYLVGLFAEFVIITILNVTGLLLLGIDYAILLGILGALLNIIPYLGGLVAVGIFMVVAFITKPFDYVLYVVVLYTFIQLIDNNYIVPKIVGSKVKLNPLVSILTVIAGAAIWGIPGMFLSIPFAAVVKVVLDRTRDYKPWGFLLGDTMPPMVKLDFTEISKKIPKNISPFRKTKKP
jgi:predicted PurR-regulated permease PerM